jgi:hypothetical protein
MTDTISLWDHVHELRNRIRALEDRIKAGGYPTLPLELLDRVRALENRLDRYGLKEDTHVWLTEPPTPTADPFAVTEKMIDVGVAAAEPYRGGPRGSVRAIFEAMIKAGTNK